MDTPDLVAIWQSAYEAQKARADALAERITLMESGVLHRSHTRTLPSNVEDAIITYSFGSEQLAAKTRSVALKMLAAEIDPSEIVQQIAKGRPVPTED